jgi:RNA polymerase sigma factor (sigma-70 family)
MNETSLSLLESLRCSPESESWSRLVDLYAPLIKSWALRYELQDSDADDVTQEVLLTASQDLGRFEHAGRPGAFRGWLKAILVNRLRNFWRARNRHAAGKNEVDLDARLARLEDPADEMSRIWNREHDQHVLRRLLALTERHFAPATWKAFCRTALDGAPADEVSRELGISLNAVFIAKSRVLNRLRQESEGLVESASNFLPAR